MSQRLAPVLARRLSVCALLAASYHAQESVARPSPGGAASPAWGGDRASSIDLLPFHSVHLFPAGASLYLAVDELHQGESDLNADGDSSDLVMHFHGLQSQQTRNLGLAFGGAFARIDGASFFTVSEADQGVDLNADADQTDLVYHAFDEATGAVTNTGLAADDTTLILTAAGRFVFRVSESATSLDGNGDGDQGDVVVMFYDVATGTTMNPSLAAPPGAPGMRLGRGVLAVLVSEASQGGADLNGDGDALDDVVHTVDVVTGAVTNGGLAALTVPNVADGVMAVGVDESHQGGQDLNGDGDATDQVLFVRELATGATVNVGLAVNDQPKAMPIEDGVVAFLVYEALQGGADLDGDGAADDRVLHVYDIASGITTNVGHPHSGFEVMLERGRLVFTIDEGLGAGDVNGDGLVFGKALLTYDVAAGTTTVAPVAIGATPIGGEGLAVVGNKVVSIGYEFLYGDQNGDGDLTDPILNVFDFDTLALEQSSLPTNGFHVHGERVTIGHLEYNEGETDLNGDGDATDYVATVVDLETGATESLGVSLKWSNGAFVAGLEAEAQKGVDLNGDGDVRDFAIAVALYP